MEHQQFEDESETRPFNIESPHQKKAQKGRSNLVVGLSIFAVSFIALYFVIALR